MELSTAQRINKSVSECGGNYHTVADWRSSYNVAPSTYMRGGYTTSDYRYNRPHEAPPATDEECMKMADFAYKNVSIVRSVIDMMADFTVDSIRIVHRDSNIQNFLNEWARYAKFRHTSERIANCLYRLGNVPVKIVYGRVPLNVENSWKITHAGSGDLTVKKDIIERKRIPLRYNILNPVSLEVVGGDVAAFISEPMYAIKVSGSLKNMVSLIRDRSLQDSKYSEILSAIPEDILAMIQSGASRIPLDKEKLRVLFYKKDDWKMWATPMLCSIFEPLNMLEKMHLSDLSALDGAISQVRLWKLGNLDKDIIPEPGALAKLRSILANVGTGVLDLVWTPDIEFQESNSQVHNYLKAEKYTQVMTEIYSGLGVPQSLTGSSSSNNTGFTNNSISMKTLVERLNYGRAIIEDFWNEQLRLIQLAFGWRFAPRVVFDRQVLADEVSEKGILMDMWDRDIISTQTIQELSRRDPELELIRLRKEKRKIEKGTMPDKASPYHSPQTEHELRKIVLQNGGATPSEVGLELLEKKEGEENMIDMKGKIEIDKAKFKPTSPGGDGRPKGSRDRVKRATKKVKPRSSMATSVGGFVSLFKWANDAQLSIAEILNPFILQNFNKVNLRQLNSNEVEIYEQLKFLVLSQVKPYSEITPEIVKTIMDSKAQIDPIYLKMYNTMAKVFEEKHGRIPTLHEQREIQSSTYALNYEEDMF